MPRPDSSSLIFPSIQPLPEVLGKPRTKEDVLYQIHTDPAANAAFLALAPQKREPFLGFCMGNRGLKVTYDPFFQHIFNPKTHPERLNRLLSCIMKQPVAVQEVLSRERIRISEDSSLIIMDILIRLKDRRLVNVEMQRTGYEFPIERASCYGADLLVRQYDLVMQKQKEQEERFSYRYIKPVYVIVLMEKSPRAFLQKPSHYIHRSLFSFDTGLKVKPLQNFIYISLDIFRKLEHNSLTELEAWLYFLGSDEPSDILRIVKHYPFFQELYQDIVNFRYQPKELITMYSDALRILDHNTVCFMIDELQAAISKMGTELSEKDSAISKMGTELSEKDSAISKMGTELSEKDSAISKMGTELSEKDSVISEKDLTISKMGTELSEKDSELSKKDSLIASLLLEIEQLKKQ